MNAAFTGFALSPTSHSKLISSPSPTTFLRRHTFKGSYAPSLSVNCELDVLETLADASGAGEGVGEPKIREADYQIVRMDAKVAGSSVVRSEVEAWVKQYVPCSVALDWSRVAQPSSLRSCCRIASPPTLFRSLRLYALLATERARTFAALCETHGKHVRTSRPPTSAKTWHDQLGVTSLTLSARYAPFAFSLQALMTDSRDL